jgi:heat shock protein HslJ
MYEITTRQSNVVNKYLKYIDLFMSHLKFNQMKPNLFNALLFGSVMLMILTCTSPKGDLTASVWSLVSVRVKGGDKILTPNIDHIPTLKISSNGTISGTTGCNRFIGNVAVTENTLKFGGIVATHMFCSDAMEMEIENALLNTFNSVDNYTIANGFLLLKTNSEVYATFQSSLSTR